MWQLPWFSGDKFEWKLASPNYFWQKGKCYAVAAYSSPCCTSQAKTAIFQGAEAFPNRSESIPDVIIRECFHAVSGRRPPGRGALSVAI